MTEFSILAEIEAFSEKHGLKPSTVCLQATSNARLFDRLKRRAQQTEEDTRRLREYMARYNAEHEAPQDNCEAAE